MSQREAIEELQPVYLAPIHLEGSPTTVETHLIVRSCREYQVRHSNLTSVQEDFYRAFIYKDIQFIVTGFLHRSPGTQSKIVDFGKDSAPHAIEAHDRRKQNSINYVDDFALGTWAPEEEY